MSSLSLEDRKTLLRNHFLLCHLRDWDLERLARHSRIASADDGDYIFRKGDAGDSMIVVISGRVVIGSRGTDNREIVFNIINPGEVFGEIAFLDEEPRTADARALEDTAYLILERRHFLPFLEENPKIAISLMTVLCQRIRNTTDQIEDVAFHELHTRLARKLVAFADHYGKPVDETQDATRIGLQLSQTELGAMLQARRETVNRQLRAWVKSGLIEMDDGWITLLDRDALEDLAAGDD